MTRLASFIASGVAGVALLLMANAAITQDTLPPPPQQAPGEVARPIVGGYRIQPNASQLETLGAEQPARRPRPKLDPITREILEGGPLSAPGSHR